MSNRILKESIRTSDEIDSLSWFEEVLFYRLIVTCDDYGRYYASPKIIKGHCFPLKEVTCKDIEKGLKKLSAVGLVTLYKVSEKSYLQLTTWSIHQNIRNQKSKFPSPDEGNCTQLNANENNCMQLQTNENNCTRNPIQSESESKSESESEYLCSEPESSEPETQFASAVITLPLNTGEEYPIFQSVYDEFVNLYPAVDVMQALRSMRGWLISNPTKRKTSRGIKKFINGWLQREQDKGGNVSYTSAKNTSTKNMTQEQYMASLQAAFGGYGEVIESD